MKVIAVDVMGNDHGPKPMIEAVVEFIEQNKSYSAIFVGDAKQINTIIRENEQISIMDVPHYIDSGAKAISGRDFTTSMAQAIKLVKDKKADVVISSGSSATYLANSILLLGRINQVKRPAFMSVLPTLKNKKRLILLDCGANTIASGLMIAQWASLAKIFAEEVLNVHHPVTGLLNVGTEKGKGLGMHEEANALLEKNTTINYIGFIEPRNLLNGDVDIAVVDGYAGNMILKTLEGTVLAIAGQVKKTLRKTKIKKLAVLALRKNLRQAFEVFDYRNVGAACVIGVKGLVIKCHGSSDKKAYKGALNQLKIQVDNNFIKKLSNFNAHEKTS